MHVHNVRDYAPPGYQLARTEYVDNRTKHVFSREGDASSEIALECAPSSAAEEIGYLESFRDMHTPKAPTESPVFSEAAMSAPLESTPVPAEVALSAMAAVIAPAKPTRKRS